MTTKAKISYPTLDTVRIEVAHPDGTPRVIVSQNRFQAVIAAARATNEANDFTPEVPDKDAQYVKALRRAVAYNTREAVALVGQGAVDRAKRMLAGDVGAHLTIKEAETLGVDPVGLAFSRLSDEVNE